MTRPRTACFVCRLEHRGGRTWSRPSASRRLRPCAPAARAAPAIPTTTTTTAGPEAATRIVRRSFVVDSLLPRDRPTNEPTGSSLPTDLALRLRALILAWRVRLGDPYVSGARVFPVLRWVEICDD